MHSHASAVLDVVATIYQQPDGDVGLNIRRQKQGLATSSWLSNKTCKYSLHYQAL